MATKWYTTKLVRRTSLAESVIGIWLVKPADYEYQAGQYTVMRLPGIEGPDAERFMSFASAPDEDTLFFAIRDGDSAFKQALRLVDETAEIHIQPAAGKLVLDNSNTPLVLLAGGIGVTPFISLLRNQASSTAKHRPIMLLHSNRHPSENAFIRELDQINRTNQNITVTGTTTGSMHTNTGPHGRIGTQLVLDTITRPKSANYMIAGSHQFISGMFDVLETLGIGKDTILAEVFCGYCPDHVCCCMEVSAEHTALPILAHH